MTPPSFAEFTVYLYVGRGSRTGDNILVNPEMVERLSGGSTDKTTMISKQSGKSVEVVGTIEEVRNRLGAS